MDLELPDGTVVQGIPDGLSKVQILNKLVASGYGGSLASAEDRAMADPTRGMSGFEKFRAGWGKRTADTMRGVQQIFTPSAGVQRDIDESKTLDAPLMRTAAGFAGNLVGGMSQVAPAFMVPGLNTYTGAALVGAGQGALEPVQTGGSRGVNTGVGALSSVLGQGAGNVVGRAIRPVAPAVNPERDRLVQMATQQGIPLRASQVTGSRPLEITESVLENLPFSSGPALAGRQAQAEAYNSAVLGTAGIRGNAATPTVMASQKATVGGELGNIAKQNDLDFNQGVLLNKLSNIVSDAGQHLPADKAKVIEGTIDKILSQVDNAGIMSGTNYQGWREPLRNLSSNTEYGRYYGQIRGALDEAFRDQLPGATGQRFRELSQQYGNVKTIANAMGGAGAQTKQGNIPPAQLEAALTQNVGREGKALGRGGPLNELVSTGRAFISDQIPNSGTAQRQIYQNLLTGGGVPLGGAGLGAGAAAATGNDPMTGALYGAGLTGASLMVPLLVQAGLSTAAAQRYLTRGLIALTPAERKLITAATTSGAVPSGLLAAQQ